MDLKDIAKPVEDYVDLFDMRFYECATNEGFFVDDISQHLLASTGKKLRPITCLLAAKIAGNVTSQTLRCALILELMHTASLIHDDVIDDSDLRRGKDSVKKKWGNNTAVLYGDYLYGRCLEIFETKEDFLLMGTFAEIGKELPLGELLERDVSSRGDYSEDSYMKVISKKTASLFEGAMELGAKSTTADVEIINALKSCGYYLGLAFQIRDDIRDYFSQEATGKVFANDIKEKKITLPLIYLLDSIKDEQEKSKVIAFIQSEDKKEKDILTLIDKVKAAGRIEKAQSKVRDFCNMARFQLDICEDSVSKNALLNLLDYISE